MNRLGVIEEVVTHKGVDVLMRVTSKGVDFLCKGVLVGYYTRQSFGNIGKSPEDKVGHFAAKKLHKALGRVVATTGIWDF